MAATCATIRYRTHGTLAEAMKPMWQRHGRSAGGRRSSMAAPDSVSDRFLRSTSSSAEGTAGCVLANRLSASGRQPRAAARGRRQRRLDPGCTSRSATSTAWAIRAPTGASRPSRSQASTAARSNYPRGKVIGGCSAINGMIYMRGQAADYDHWRQLGNPGWGWDDVLPYFSQSKTRIATAPADSEARPGGEWRVERAAACAGRSSTPSARPPASSASQPVDDFNGGDNEGVGYFEVNQRNGMRWSAATGLPEAGAASAPTSTLVTHAQALRLPIDGGRVDRRRASAIRAGHEVSATAREVHPRRPGAVNSPHLLRALGHRRADAAAAATASRSCTRCPASARTCRTTCSCG